MERIELGFPQRPFTQLKLERRVVEPARGEAAMERPQSRDDHPYDRSLDVRASLVEDEDIKPMPLCELDARQYLLAPVEAREFRRPPAPGSPAARPQIGMLAQRQRIDPGAAGLVGGRAPHPVDGQKL